MYRSLQYRERASHCIFLVGAGVVWCGAGWRGDLGGVEGAVRARLSVVAAGTLAVHTGGGGGVRGDVEGGRGLWWSWAVYRATPVHISLFTT